MSSNADNTSHKASDMMHEVAGDATRMMHEVADDATRMVKQFRKNVNPMDTTSLLLVFGVTILALILGSFLWNSVVGGTKTYTDATGLKVTFPSSWASSDSGLATASAGTIVVKPAIASNQPATLFQVDRVAVDASAPATTTLGVIANDLATTKGRQLNAFKVLSSAGFTGTDKDKKPIQIKGLPGYKLAYVYVSSPANPLRGNIPSVILGDAWLVLKADKAYVFTFESTDTNHDANMSFFENFVDSAQLP